MQMTIGLRAYAIGEVVRAGLSMKRPCLDKLMPL